VRIAVTAPLVAPLLDRQAHGNHQVLLDVARGLAGRGHEVTVFCAEGSDVSDIRRVEIPVDDDVRRQTIIPGSEPAVVDGDGMRRAFGRLFDEVRRFRPDAVSQHAFDAHAFEAADDLPVVHTVHLPPILPEVVRACTLTSRQVATVSEDARARWHAASIDAILLRNGVPDPLDDGEVPERADRDPAAVVAGRISREKGTAAAIRAAGRAGLRAEVVGTVHDPEYYAADVEPLLHEPHMTFLGAVTRAELFDLLLRAEVTIMPVEWDEPFGLVAAEAQMVGCPVVAYNRGALPEIVEHGLGGWIVPPGDESALVGATAAAASLPRQEIRESARRRLGLCPMLDAYEEALTAAAAGQRPERKVTTRSRKEVSRTSTPPITSASTSGNG
jgi:glycosyltransferase involved in cell wall biosynthesis